MFDNDNRALWRTLLAILAAVTIVAAACGDGDDTATTEETSEAAEEPADDADAEDDDAEAAEEPDEPADDAEAEEADADAAEGEADDECPLGRSPNPPADDLLPLRIVSLPIVDVAGIEYAHRCGYFAANGIESSIEVAASGPDAAQLVGTGEADVGVSAWHPLAPGWGAGAVPFVVAVDGAVLPPGAANLMVAADSDIETINDLEGRTIAVNTSGALTEVALRTAFAAADADFSTVTLVTVPIPEMVAALTAGSVDAMSAFEPVTSVGIASGLKVIEPELLAGDFQNGSTGGFVATAQWAEANEETISRARTAWREVNELFAADEAGLRAFIPVFTGIPPELAETMLLPDPRLTTEVANVQPSVDITAEAGLIPETFDVTPFVAYPED